MQYLILLSALLSLATAVLAQDIDAPADDGDEAVAVGSTSESGSVSAPASEQDLLDDSVDQGL